jgi:hypothetical protein
MIARAASCQASAARPPASWGSRAAILASSSIGPIGPVAASSTSRWRQPSRLAAAAASRREASKPALPVSALAQPELATRARASPPLASNCWRDQSTGAAAAAWRVNTPAAIVPGAKRITITSGRWRRCSPARAAATSTPATGGIAGNGTARGET